MSSFYFPQPHPVFPSTLVSIRCLFPTSPPSVAVTGCLAESRDLCARLVFTTATRSASASPTTWGLSGINQSEADRGKLQMLPFIALQHETGNLLAWDKRRAGKWNYTFYMYWITTDYKQHLRSFISAVFALTQMRMGVLPSETKRPKQPPTCSKTHKSGGISAKERKWGDIFDSLRLCLTCVGLFPRH